MIYGDTGYYSILIFSSFFISDIKKEEREEKEINIGKKSENDAF